jgi:transcriptional regulator with XRE-family HTH domain
MNADSRRLGDYLRARRSRVTPEAVGLPPDPHRRVPGLRREEVADLAGISLEYYTRLEQGHPYQLSEQVLAGLARALRLDAPSSEYFYRLALPVPAIRPAGTGTALSPIVRSLLDQWSGIPVYVFDRNQDVLATNDLAKAMFREFALPGANCVLATFSTPAEGRSIESWQRTARGGVAALRFHGDPSDRRLQEIVGELSVRDNDFRSMWADHEARPYDSGTAPALIEGFGFGEFPWQLLNLPDGLFMVLWLAPPNTFAAAAIEHLNATLRGSDAPQELAS